jgi:hypothetical protein
VDLGGLGWGVKVFSASSSSLDGIRMIFRRGLRNLLGWFGLCGDYTRSTDYYFGWLPSPFGLDCRRYRFACGLLIASEEAVGFAVGLFGLRIILGMDFVFGVGGGRIFAGSYIDSEKPCSYRNRCSFFRSR